MSTATTSSATFSIEEFIRQFNSGLQKVRFELEKGLAELNPLDYARLSNFLEVFNQRLVVFQYDFLDLVAQARGSVQESTVRLRLKAARSWHKLAGIFGGISGGLLAKVLAEKLKLIAVKTGHLWWQKTVWVSLAAWLAPKLGISVAATAGGIGLVAGIVVGLLIARAVARSEQRRIRQTILTTLSRDIEPKLQAWAKECVAQ